MKVIKSNGYLITFPLIWIVIAVNDAGKGKLGEALFDVGLAVLMLLIPHVIDRIRRDAQKAEDNPFMRLAESIDQLKLMVVSEVTKLIERAAKLLGGLK